MTKCVDCRVRHLQCSSDSPCKECTKHGRDCRRLNVRFKNLVCPSESVSRSDISKYEFFFEGEQTWVDTDGEIEFVTSDDGNIESGSLNGLEASDQNAVEASKNPGPVLEQQEYPGIGSRPYSSNPGNGIINQDDDPSDYAMASEKAKYDTSPDMFADQASSIPVFQLVKTSHDGARPNPGTNASSLETLMSLPETTWPLKNLQERNLFQHWITHLASWFDVGDSKRHFAKVVTCMAASSPLLMTAILAMSALHHGRVSGQGDSYDAMAYHTRCLNMIVPMLSDAERVKDTTVLLTTTILHLYDGIGSGYDLPRHLEGAYSLFPTDAMCNTSQLRRAVFWLHLRQEIYNAYLHQRSVKTDLSHYNYDVENEAEDDDSWLHQTLYIAAQTTKWAFGEDLSLARWQQLSQMVAAWEAKRPATFDPIYYRSQDIQNGKYFPDIAFVTDEHVCAAHFIYMAKLLLTTHDPKLPRVGPRKKSAEATMQKTALSYVRILVGSAACNNCMPARFTAYLTITICASWFTDRGEQEALVEFLDETSRVSGLAVGNAKQTMCKEWGWEDNES